MVFYGIKYASFMYSNNFPCVLLDLLYQHEVSTPTWLTQKLAYLIHT